MLASIVPAPSPHLEAARGAARQAWTGGTPQVNDRLSMTADRTAANVLSVLPALHPAQIGWGIFGVGRYEMVEAERIEPLVRPALAVEFVDNLHSTAQLVCRVGDRLIGMDPTLDRRDARPSTEPDMHPSVIRMRAELVQTAVTNFDWLMRTREVSADLCDQIRGDGREGRDTLLDELAGELAGIDIGQVGWGLLACGMMFLELAADRAQEAAALARRERRPPQPGAWVAATFMGSTLIVAGDEWAGPSPVPG